MIVCNPLTGQVINANPEGHNQYWNPDGIAYHGTDSPEEFGAEDIGKKTRFKTSEGIYFSTKPEGANLYAGIRENARVYPVKLDLRNPKIVPRDKIGNFRKGELSGEGHDGAISDDGEEVVVLRPDQIKSAITSKGRSKTISDLSEEDEENMSFDELAELFKSKYGKR